MSILESYDMSSSEFTFKRNDILTDNTINEMTEHNYINQNGGGILDTLFGKNELSTILLESFTDGRPDIACYLLCKLKKCECDVCITDNMNRNLLHYMTIYASHGNMVIHIGKLFRTCSKMKLKKALKQQDKLGNTPLHYATELGFNNLVKLYIDNGADKSIRNKKGEYVDEDNNMSDRSNKSDKKCKNTPVDVSIIMASPQPNEVVMFSPTEVFDTDHFINEIKNEMDSKNNTKKIGDEIVKKISNEYIDDTTILTDDIINQIIKKTEKNDKSDREIEIEYVEPIDIMRTLEKNERNVNVNEELTDILNRVKSKDMYGGAKKKSKNKSKNKSKKSRLGRLVVGERKLITYSEMTYSDNSLDSIKSSNLSNLSNLSNSIKSSNLIEPIDSNDSDVSDMAREISRQSSDIHERVVMKIIELLKLDKDNEKDVQKARNYKAALYRMVKEKNPLLNNFDRAVEMEKSVTKEILKSIDINKVSKEIEQHLKEKSVSTASSTASSTLSLNTKASKSDSDTLSETSKSEKKSDKKEKKTSKKQKRHLPYNDGTITIEFSTISEF
jgi:hypothetical protein